MARYSAITAVANAVKTAIDVTAFRALCLGGVYRAFQPTQAPPYCVIGRCSEEPADALGFGYGSVVTVPITIAMVAADAVPEDRAVAIVDKLLQLLDEPASLTVTNWAVRGVAWVGNQPTTIELADGSAVDALVATFQVAVRRTAA